MTSLSDQLKSSNDAGSRVIFLELKEEVMMAISKGWTLKAAWNVLSNEGKFPFTYALFVRHYNRFCKDEKLTDRNKDKTTPAHTAPPTPQSESPKTDKPVGLIVAGKPKKSPFVDPDPMVSTENLI